MRLIETKGMVKFYKTESGEIYQQIGEGKVEKVANGKHKYKYIKQEGNYFIQYHLNGVHGFSICNKCGILEDNIWDLDEAIAIAKIME